MTVVLTNIPLDSSGITVPQIAPSGPNADLQVSEGLFDIVGGIIIGGLTGGIPGAIAGGAAAAFTGSGPSPAQECPPFTMRVGDACVDPLAGLPGGRPAVTRPTGTDVAIPPTVLPSQVGEGVFGLLSTAPHQVGQINGRAVLRCPVPGLVLGKDNRCYSRKDLPNKLRKWPKRKVTCATDRKIAAIKGAGAAAKSLQRSFKGSGFKISRTGK